MERPCSCPQIAGVTKLEGYPPIQQIWNNDTYPGTNIDRLIARGLTLCDW
jgi:hypothetical protein